MWRIGQLVSYRGYVYRIENYYTEGPFKGLYLILPTTGKPPGTYASGNDLHPTAVALHTDPFWRSRS